jgi:hypothetical protein
MDDIKSRNIEEFIDSLSGDDHEDVLNIVTCIDGLEFSMSIDDVLDYLETYHHDVYEEFTHIFTRIIKKKDIDVDLDDYEQHEESLREIERGQQ